MNVFAWLYDRYRFRRWADVGWTGAGLALGTACAYFPLYVQWNSEAFDPPQMVYSKDREAGSAVQVTEFDPPDLAPFNVWSLTQPIVVDEVTTGTVPVREAVSNDPPPVFDSRVRSIVSSRAGGFLIAGPDGIDFVPLGGVVAGSGRIDRVEMVSGRVAIITASGERILSQLADPQATDK
ncbi:MAG: hypothetical protein AAF940_02765 [Pseudomonadota bacterium]